LKKKKIENLFEVLFSLTRKTSLAFRLFADASPSHFFNSFTSQINCSFSTLRPTNNSFNLSFDHCVAFFSFQCQLFGFVAKKKNYFSRLYKKIRILFFFSPSGRSSTIQRGSPLPHSAI
jgi:hypothetical protein